MTLEGGWRGGRGVGGSYRAEVGEKEERGLNGERAGGLLFETQRRRLSVCVIVLPLCMPHATSSSSSSSQVKSVFVYAIPTSLLFFSPPVLCSENVGLPPSLPLPFFLPFVNLETRTQCVLVLEAKPRLPSLSPPFSDASPSSVWGGRVGTLQIVRLGRVATAHA